MNRIAFLRRSRGLSQRELADLVGTSGQQIGRLENGARRLTVDWMERLAAALGCEPGEILAGYGEPPPPDDLPQRLSRIEAQLTAIQVLIKKRAV